jgi:hypothetical protein
MSATPVKRRVRGVYGDYEVVGDAISKGGVGAIFRTTDPKWVYKEYHAPEKAPPSDHLQRLVTVGRDVLISQGLPIGSRPESSINWPVDIVRTADGRIIGCVLPAIPDRYFHPTHKGVNTLDFLVMRRSAPPAAKFRMVVLLRMAEILAFVHSKKLVHGDVNAKNVAWTLDPEPAAYLIDCDGMVPQDPPPRTGVQANYWTDPRVVDRVVPAHDQYSDWYCLALAFYRGLLLPNGGSLGKHNGVWSAPGQIPADLDPRIAALLRRGLTDPLDPSRRPEPAEWTRTLIEVYVSGSRYDEAALAKLDRAPAAPKPAPVPPVQPSPMLFQPLPQASAPPPQSYYLPPPQQQPPPAPQPAQPPVQWQHSYPAPPYGTPVPQYGNPPPPYGVPPQRPGYNGRPGSLALWAMRGGARWYVPLVLLTLFLWPASAIVCGIVLAQTAQVDSRHEGRSYALISSSVGLAVSVMCFLACLGNA